jgi:hypothetical protein
LDNESGVNQGLPCVLAYIQLTRAVAYIVLSSRDEASYHKGAPALQEVLKTLVYLEPKDESKPR